MLSLVARASVMAGALALALAGCGLSDPYAPIHHGSRPTISRGAGEPDDDGPSPPRLSATPGGAAATPQAALTRYGALYVNWTRSTLAADARKLASLSTGQARAQALAEASDPPATLTRYDVSNAGSVVAIAAGQGIERGRWAVVTDEQTSGYGPYLGLPATSHITWATVARVAGGWVVSGWYPGS
jgi:hypothetical protein